MKIIKVDSFDRETVDDVLICENINEWYGKKLVDFLNYSFDYYKLVEDDYKLHVWKP